MLTKDDGLNMEAHRGTKDKKKSGLSLELTVKNPYVGSKKKKKTKTSSINKPTTTMRTKEFRHVLPMPACVADDDYKKGRKNSGMCCRCRHVLPMRRESPMRVSKFEVVCRL